VKPQEPEHRKATGSSEEDERASTTPSRDDSTENSEARLTEEPDVLLDVPKLNVEELNLEVDNLRVLVSAKAELTGFLNINVGVDAYLEKVKLEVKGVEAQVQLKVNLERMLGSIDKALEAIGYNPELLNSSSRGADQGPEGTDGQREIPAGMPVPDDPATKSRHGRDEAGVEVTEAARRKAEELDVDLSQLKGTGAGGRVLVKDVKEAAK
jgi:pyruvate/2-oxoglutarate dehydrogenase complex dihydrolipoamide acyltransferase (E2) component